MEIMSLGNFSSDKLCNLGTFFTELAKSETPNTCIHLSSADNSCIGHSAYLFLPQTLLHDFGIMLSSKEFDGYKKIVLNILHPLDVDINGNDKIFLTFEQLSKKYNYNPDIFQARENYAVFGEYLLTPRKRITELAHPLNWASGFIITALRENNSNKFRITMSEKTLTVDNIFIDLNDEMVKKILPTLKEADPLLNLSKNQKSAVKKIIDLGGIDRLETLSFIHDPNWEYYSTEAHAIIDLQEALFVKNEGNPKEGVISRAAKLLQIKYPQITGTGELPRKADRYNSATKRITTAANSDKKK